VGASVELCNDREELPTVQHSRLAVGVTPADAEVCASEVVAMQVTDLSLRSVPPTATIGHGKGGKSRVVPAQRAARLAERCFPRSWQPRGQLQSVIVTDGLRRYVLA